MRFTDFFIRRPVTTTLFMAGLLTFGLLGYFALPVSDLPPVEYPTIMVSAGLPGANAETMASTVATPLERQFSTIAGIETMSSSSSLGRTSITLQFALERDIDAAAQDVQAAISQAARSLPPNLPAPPSYSKVNPGDQAILFLTLRSPTLLGSQVDEYAQTVLAQRISMVTGVAQVQVFGTQKYAVRVQIDPERLAAKRVGLDEVRDAVARGSVKLPGGALWGANRTFTVEANTQLQNAAGFRPLIVAYRNGSPVRLEQLGRVLDSVQNDKSVFWWNQDRVIMLAVQKQPGTNTVAVVDRIKALLPAIRTQMPADLSMDIEYDRSASIRESIADVKLTLGLTVGLVILVIFLFLRNGSATMIPSVAVPLSLIGTFAAMYLLDYSVDNLSLMAMTLSVGFVVDDAIVVLENIVRHREMGTPRLEAAFRGAREIGFTVISMTVSLVAVFIPVLFMGGIVGRLLREFSVTIAVSILISGVISLTLTPMLCSRYLRHGDASKQGPLSRLFDRGFQALHDGYDLTLRFCLRRRLAVLTLNIGLAAASIYLLAVIPKGFIPTEDAGMVMGGTEAAEDASFEEMAKLQRAVGDRVGASPHVASYVTGVGGGGPGGGGINSGFLFMQLKDRRQRPHANQVIQELRASLARIPGINVFLRVPPVIAIGQQGRLLYLVTMQDADTTLLYNWAPQLEARMRTLETLQDVTSDLRLASPRVNVEVNRDKALAVGVAPDSIASALFSAYGSRQVATINTASNEYYVILEVLPEFQRDPDALNKLYLRSNTGNPIPLSAVTSVRPGVAPLSVNHVGQLPAVNISFNLRPGAALSDAVAGIEDAARQLGLPGTTAVNFQGAAQAFQSSLKGLGLLLLIAIAVVYLVLGVLYESFVHPLTILSGLPSAGLGAVATLMLFGYELNLYGFVGLILLIGIVKKNAIMMIDFAIQAQREGRSPLEAIHQGCLLRFRPIMMTTMAALLGSLPIALGAGAGSESRRPLGLAVVGGLLVSQFLTLYLTPIVYLYLEKFQGLFRASGVPLAEKR